MARNHITAVLPDIDIIVLSWKLAQLNFLGTRCYAVNQKEYFPIYAWVSQNASLIRDLIGRINKTLSQYTEANPPRIKIVSKVCCRYKASPTPPPKAPICFIY